MQLSRFPFINRALPCYREVTVTGQTLLGSQHVGKIKVAGPMGCEAFQLNNQHRDPQNVDVSLRIRQQCVTLAQALLA